MGVRQQISASKGGTISATFPFVPASATVTIYDPDGREVVAATPATVRTSALAITSWSADNPRVLGFTTFDTPYPTVGTEWLLFYGTGADEASSREMVRIASVDITAKQVFLADAPEHNLAAPYGSLQDVRARYTVGASALEYGNYFRAEFQTSSFTREVLFDVVHSPAWNAATAAGLRRYRPFIADEWQTQYSEGHSFTDMLEAAYEGVLRDLEASVTQTGHDLIYGIVDWSQLDQVIYHRLLWDQGHSMIPKDWSQTPDLYLETQRVDYGRALRNFQASIRYVDPQQTRAASEERRFPLKRIML